jgi:hypothetical protein
VNAYALYPTRQKVPTWVGYVLAGLGATFVLLTVAVVMVVVRSQPAAAAVDVATLVAPKPVVAPVAQPVVAPQPADEQAPADTVAAAAPAPKAKHVKRHIAAKRTYVASAATPRASKKAHKKDDLEKLLGL